MTRNLLKKITVLFLIYGILFIISEQLANFLVALSAILLIPTLIAIFVLREKFYKLGINFVNRSFVLGANALANDYCIVKYTPNTKIVITDNLGVQKKNVIRSLILTPQNVGNINKCWYEICKIFDDTTYLDLIAAFFKKTALIEKTVLRTNDENIQNEKPVQRTSVEPPVMKRAEFNKNIDKDNNGKSIYQKEKFKPAASHEQDLIDLGDILSVNDNDGKIDVNTASSEEISSLPGINIVMAKKIVDFRNKERLFNSVDDFIKVSKVKPHFYSQIESMIYVGKSQSCENKIDDSDDGRIVDF